jgi:ribose 5-phosphate isomerase A
MKRDGSDEYDAAAIRAAKRHAGRRAAETVESGAVVGLGTGSTAAHAIEALGERQDDGFSIRGIPTSFQSRQLAIEAGIDLVDLDEVAGVDVAIDGADQVADGTLIKGGGGAHAREKVIDAAADRFLVVVDPRKETDALTQPVPVEVLPAARPTVAAELRDVGGDPTLRSAKRKDGPVVTDNGNLVIDADFGTVEDPAGLARDIDGIPGVVEHGLFVGLADRIYVGTAEGVDVRDA